MWSKKDENREEEATATLGAPLLPVAEQVNAATSTGEQTLTSRLVVGQTGQQQGSDENSDFHTVAVNVHEETTQDNDEELPHCVPQWFFFVWACLGTFSLGSGCIVTLITGTETIAGAYELFDAILALLAIVGTFVAVFYSLKRTWKAYYAQHYGIVFVLPVFASMLIALVMRFLYSVDDWSL